MHLARENVRWPASYWSVSWYLTAKYRSHSRNPFDHQPPSQSFRLFSSWGTIASPNCQWCEQPPVSLASYDFPNPQIHVKLHWLRAGLSKSCWFLSALAVLSSSLRTVRTVSQDSHETPTAQSIPQEWEIKENELKLHCIDGRPIELGRGGHGIVLWGQVHKEDTAVKIIKGMGEEEAMLREIMILERAKTKYVVRFLGYSLSADGLLMAMEYARGGNLYDALRNGGEFQWYNRSVNDLCKLTPSYSCKVGRDTIILAQQLQQQGSLFGIFNAECPLIGPSLTKAWEFWYEKCSRSIHSPAHVYSICQNLHRAVNPAQHLKLWHCRPANWLLLARQLNTVVSFSSTEVKLKFLSRYICKRAEWS